MKKILTIASIGLLSGCSQQSFEAEFGQPLPQDVVIADSATVQRGPDTSYFFRLTDWQDEDLSSIVSQSRLQHWTGEPTASLPVNVPGPPAGRLPEWWDRDKLSALPEIYGRMDDSAERSWWIFVDRDKSQLYLNSEDW